MNKENTQNLLKLQIFFFFSEALIHYIDKASEKKRIICNFNKFCVFFYSYIFDERTHSKLVFLMYIYIYIHVYIYIYIYVIYTVYIYVYRERQRQTAYDRT